MDRFLCLGVLSRHPVLHCMLPTLLFFLLFFSEAGLAVPVTGSSVPEYGGRGGVRSADAAMMEEVVGEMEKKLLPRLEAAFRKGNWEECLSLAGSVLVLRDTNPEALGILGSCLALIGRQQEAGSVLARIKAESGHTGFYACLIDAIRSAQLNDLDGALAEIGRALALDGDHPVALYYLGSIHLARGELDEAEAALRRAIADSPDFPGAQAGMGSISRRRGDLDKALAYYHRAVDLAPEILFYRQQLVELYREKGQKDKAGLEMEGYLNHLPEVKQARLSRGMELLVQGKYRAASNLMDEILNVFSSAPKAEYIKGAALLHLDQPEEAGRHIASFISQEFGSSRAHRYAGIFYLASGDPIRAGKHFAMAAALQPDSTQNVLAMAVAHQLQGDRQQALQEVHAVQEQEGHSPLAWYLAANISLGSGDQAAYEKGVKEAVRLVPGLDRPDIIVPPSREKQVKSGEAANLMIFFFANAWYDQAIRFGDALQAVSADDLFAWYFKAMAHVAKQDKANAVAAFEKLLALRPGLLASHMGLGRIYLENGEFDKAAQAFDKAVHLQADPVHAYLGLGDARFGLGNMEGARDAFQEALELDPAHAGIYRRLARVAEKKREGGEESLDLAAKAVELNPDDPLSHDLLGWLYLQHGDATGKALQHLQKAVALRPGDPVMQYHLGAAFVQGDQLESGRRALRAALAISGSFPGAGEARKLLDSMK